MRRALRWLPLAFAGHLLVGVPALAISLVVAWGTFEQARATQKMQQAAAWPFVAFETSNYTPEGKHRISLSLVNNGVGPAILGPLEMRYGGAVMRDPVQLLAACCGYRAGGSMQLATSPATGVVLRPGERSEFLNLPDLPVNARMVARLEAARLRLDVRACYCSIFQDCWTIAGEKATPAAVKSCPADWAVYRER